MTSRNGHLRSVGVYIAFVSLVAVAVLGYQWHTNQRLDRVDRAACSNAEVLVANQQRVIGYLLTHLVAPLRDPKSNKLWLVEFTNGLRSVPTPYCKP